MESDLRFIDIAGEDDGSLLTPLPDMDSSTTDFDSFSTFISPLRGLQGSLNPAKPGSSRRGSRNKENINTDKAAEVPKLSIEPLFMKRKKKGGAYNLQKSLAWDKAFSTEKGILDPRELSLLTGTCIEKNKQKASSKVLLSRGSSRSLSSPFLSHVKSANKDSKLPKFQVSKQSSCLLPPTNSRNTLPRTSHLKHQVTDSAVSIQKAAGLRSSSKKVRNVQENAERVAESLKDKSSFTLKVNHEKSKLEFPASRESLPPITKALESTVPSCQADLSRPMKPSCLRMPSPTLGFFRAIASDTHFLLNAESSVMLPEALAKGRGSDKSANLNCGILGLRSESSTATCKGVKPTLDGNTVERSNIPHVFKNFDRVSDKCNVELLMNGEQQNGKVEQINKEVDHRNSIPDFIENKGLSGSDFRDSQSPQADDKRQPVVVHGATDISDETEESCCRSVVNASICKTIMKMKRNLCDAQKVLRNNGSTNCESNLSVSEFSEERIEISEQSHNLKEALPCKRITDRAQTTGDLVVEESSGALSYEKYESTSGLPIFSKHKSPRGDVLHSSTTVQTEVESNSVTVVGEDAADIICFSPVKITLPENHTRSADEEFNHDMTLANSTTCLKFGSSSSVTRDPMVQSAALGSVGQCGKPIKEESVLEVMDEAEICDSSNRQNECRLISSMEFGSFSMGTQYEIDSGIAGPMSEGNNLIKDMCPLEGLDEPEIGDSSQRTVKNFTETVTTSCIELVEGDKVIDTLNRDIVLKESETGESTGSESSNYERCHGLDDSKRCRDDSTILPVDKSESSMKKDNLLIVPPRNVVPFSDEWLEAIEAAGEDILTKKGGAVQNSPPEKSLPEPSPWSPVKKKNNQLGPYDCTKFNHNLTPDS